MNMFCYQCEQTAKGTGCTTAGVCGKTPEAANLADDILHICGAISQYAHGARELQAKTPEADLFVVQALFTTVTNVNFDPARLKDWLSRGEKIRALTRKI